MLSNYSILPPKGLKVLKIIGYPVYVSKHLHSAQYNGTTLKQQSPPSKLQSKVFASSWQYPSPTKWGISQTVIKYNYEQFKKKLSEIFAGFCSNFECLCSEKLIDQKALLVSVITRSKLEY